MILIRPFKVSDLTEFVPIEPLAKAEIGDPEFAQAIENTELAVTGVRNGKVVGYGGVRPVEGDDSHGEMWIRLSRDCLNFKIETLRLIKTGIKIIEDAWQFKQLSATVKCCFKESINLIERLGFVEVEQKEHEGQNWVIYSKRVHE